MKTKLLYFLLMFVFIGTSASAQLTSGNVTIKLAGGDYSSWTAFWDDLGNLTGNITCTVDASAFTEAAAPAVVTESLGGYTLHIKPASFPSTTDGSTGARITMNGVTNAIVNLQMEGAGAVIIEGMVLIDGAGTQNYAILINIIDTQFDLTIRRNIVIGLDSDGIFHDDATMVDNQMVYNNIAINCARWGIAFLRDCPNGIFANNTIVDNNDGLMAGGNDLDFINNLSYSNTTADFSQIAVSTNGYNNAGSDVSGEDADWGGIGTNNLANISDPFNNFAADDFTITAGGVIGEAGLDMSGSFTDDFFGVERVNWTIGAVEFVASGWSGSIYGVSSPAKVYGTEVNAVYGVE